MNDHKQELVKTDRRYCILKKKVAPTLPLPLPFRSLCQSLSRFPNNKFKLLTVTNKTRKYFIHSNCH